MQSIQELYKIGNGPSSSHTMGPERASRKFKMQYPEADRYQVILYGSLAMTGKGHLTDAIIKKTLGEEKVEIEFNKIEKCEVHPNTMDFIAFQKGKQIGKWRVYSIGGGTIQIEGEEKHKVEEIYPLTTFSKIAKYCNEKQISLYDYVYEVEEEAIHKFLKVVWDSMKNAIETGIRSQGIIPGKLQIQKRAKQLYEKEILNETKEYKQSRLLTAYAYAVSETNASGGIIVTAPTCGASGVLPAVLYYIKDQYSEQEIINALATAGLIGNLIKNNASISGAECGCQAEIGSACSMAAAAYAQLKGATISEIECAAEIAMEHHLGLTCDPIYGYVQIPCIERNAVAAMRAVDAGNISFLLADSKKISFDMVVDTMYETGKDLQSHYRETSQGGLAKKYCRNKYYNPEIEGEINLT